jgi:hypothetical protein
MAHLQGGLHTPPLPLGRAPQSLDPEVTCFHTINMNSFSDAPSLQIMLEQPLEKKSGVRYGPPGSRRQAGRRGGAGQGCTHWEPALI